MGFKLKVPSLPKSLGVNIKPVNEWGPKEYATAAAVLGTGGLAGAGMLAAGAAGAGAAGAMGGLAAGGAAATLGAGIAGNQAGGMIQKMRSDAAAKRAAGDAARAADAERVANEYITERNVSRSALEGMMGTTVPGVSAAPLDPAFRNAQMDLLQQLTKTSQGQGPSLAQMQFQQAGNTALQKSMGAIRAATGANAALGGRTAALASTNMLGNIAAESGMARLKEQQDAQNALAALSSAGRTSDLQARQQDINLGTSNAELAIKNLAQRQAAAGELLGDTRARFEGNYNRGAQIDAAKGKGGGSNNQLLGGLLGAAGAAVGTMYGGPVGGAAGAAAGKAAGDSLGLVGRPANVKDYKADKESRSLKQGPFGKMAR